MAKIKSCCYIEVDLKKIIVRFLYRSTSLILSSIMPYPTRSCVVIEPAVQFMGFLIQLEPFDYSAKIVDRQKLVYEMYHEDTNHHEKPSPGINHDLTVKIDGVVKISVQKISQSNCNKFSINMFKHDHEKRVDVLFRALTT